MESKIKTCINSEVGKLEYVLIHSPGPEVENMTPEHAERALYSDLLNLKIASDEYDQLKGVLKKVSNPIEIKSLLIDILNDDKTKINLISQICINEEVSSLENILINQETNKLARLLIEGLPLEKNNLTNYLSNENYILPPLHNLFFTRDSAMVLNNSVLIGKMANQIRERESIIMDFIFNYHPIFETSTINPSNSNNLRDIDDIKIEGGDFLVAREDILVIGTGTRTTTQGIDFIIENLQSHKKNRHYIIVQELPSQPESFIHLDMVFTFLDVDSCVAYHPVIFEMNRHRTILITIDNGKVNKINEEPNIPKALKKLGMDLKIIPCGAENNSWIQEREQWHSGTNFFAFAPGKIIGYERNINTIESLNKNGFEVLKACDVIGGKLHPDNYSKCVVTIEGSELARGGGGARCMTLPVRRTEI